MSEYWMIEKSINGVAHWWIRKDGQNEWWDLPHRWTTDSSKARHYESKSDAEWVMGTDMVGCIATGHIDCLGPDLITIEQLERENADLRKQLAKEKAENEVLREQNFAMNKTIAEARVPEGWKLIGTVVDLNDDIGTQIIDYDNKARSELSIGTLIYAAPTKPE